MLYNYRKREHEEPPRARGKAKRCRRAELEAEAEALTDKLKACMVEREAETLTGDGWKASWKNVNSSRFDSKAFKADHADLYGAYCKTTTTTTRFTITV